MERICEKRSLGNKERKTTSKFMFVLFFLLLLSAAIAFIGITSAKTIHVPDDYPTIQQAVDDATDGDTVIVHSGTYYEHVMIGQSLTIIGDGAIIDAGGEFQCLDMRSTSGSIRGFTVQNGDIGIALSHASNINVEGNTALNNKVGFHLWDSNNNNIKNNVAQGSGHSGISIHGWDGAEGSSYNTISNNELSNNGEGIYIYISSNYNTITNNEISNNDEGIDIDRSSSYNTITNNEISNNNEGIDIDESSNYNEIINNIIMSNKYEGIHIHDSCSSNTIADNEISNNDLGIYIETSSNYNEITNNIVMNNKYEGIYIWDSCDGNTITDNEVLNNDVGICIEDSGDNLIHHNNLINNSQNAYDDMGNNSWDNGYPYGGNYWSDYEGEDKKSGHDQDKEGSDGVGDTPYYIPGGAGAKDNYPLIQPPGEQPHNFVILKEFDSPGDNPTGLTWDGNYLWNADWSTDKIYKIDPDTGEVIKEISSPGTVPFGLAWDGNYLWNADFYSGKIYKIDTNTGEVIRAIESPGGAFSTGLAWDGNYLWSVSQQTYKIYKIEPDTGEVLKEFNFPGDSPTGLAWIGNYLWSANSYMWGGTTAEIYKIDPDTGEIKEGFNAPCDYIAGLAWDGDYLWTVDWHPKIFKLGQPPIASFTYSPAKPVVNEMITFDASNSTDPDGNITKYEWEFGDGNATNTTEKIITHSYALVGNYTVNLTVTDDDGAINSTSQIVIVHSLTAVFDTGAPAPTIGERAKIREEASNEQVAVTVHSVKFYDQITGGLGGTYKPKQEGDAFVIVDMSIRNVGGSVLKVSPAYLRLFDNQDNRCSRIMMLIIAGVPYELEKLRSEELSPDEERRGMVIFTAKVGTILDKVSYTTPKPAIDVSLEDLEVSVPPYWMPGIGEVAIGGGIEMRVSSVGSVEKLEKEYGDEEFKLIWTETAKEGQELVVVDLSIKNVFIEPNITINPLYVLLIDTESKVYNKAVLTIALEGELGLTDLSPGEETTGRLLFSVPADVTLDRVMYKIGALGPPVQVNLRG